MGNAKTYVARTVLVIALLLLVINISSYDLLASYTARAEKTLENINMCKQLYSGIDLNVTFTYRGKSISGNRADTWYDIHGCGNKLVYTRISRPLYIETDKAVILIHDYRSDYHALIGLALKLVARGYIVVQLGLPSDGLKKIDVLSKDPRNSWIYESVCNTMKALTLLVKEYNPKNIGVIGVGFGGIVALLTLRYDERVDYAVSVTGIGDYVNSIRRASLLNYYIQSPSDADPCLDPIYVVDELSEFDKPVLIVVGTNDEINPLSPSILNKLAENKNVIVSVIPNGNRYRVPIQ